MTNRPARWSPEGYTPPEPDGETLPQGRLPLVGDIILIQIDDGADDVPGIITKVFGETANLTVWGDGPSEKLEKAPYGHRRGHWHWREDDSPRDG